MGRGDAYEIFHCLEHTLVIGRYEAGENLFIQDEPTIGLRIILEGRVAVEHVDSDGNAVWGELIGIAGLWDAAGYPRSA